MESEHSFPGGGIDEKSSARTRAAKDGRKPIWPTNSGVSRQTIHPLKRRRIHPSLPLAFKVARLFKSSIEDISPRIRRGLKSTQRREGAKRMKAGSETGAPHLRLCVFALKSPR